MKSLICFICGTEVPRYAEKCPKCGCRINAIIKRTYKGKSEYKNGRCLFNGKEYGLTSVERLMYEGNEIGAAKLLCQQLGINTANAYVFANVIKFNDNKIPYDYAKALKDMQEYNMTIREVKAIHCPRCHSTNVEERSRRANPLVPRIWYNYCKNCGEEF